MDKHARKPMTALAVPGAIVLCAHDGSTFSMTPEVAEQLARALPSLALNARKMGQVEADVPPVAGHAADSWG